MVLKKKLVKKTKPKLRSSEEGSGGFAYKKRSKAKMRKRANQSGGMYDNPVLDRFPTFTAKEGDHSIRILPPTWDDPEHYGLDVWVHGQVGPDGQMYLCLDKMKGKPCPLCKEANRATREGNTDYARDLKARKRVGLFLIDRNAEDEGPKVWLMPWTLDRDIALLCEDKRTGEVFALDDPDEGFDVEFERKGKKRNTEYIGIKIARSSTPLSDSPKTQRKWLKFVVDNPIPSVLNYYEADYIKGVFEAGSRPEEDDAEEKPKTRKERSSRTEDEDERPARRKVKKYEIEDEEDPLADKKTKKVKRMKLRDKIKSGTKKFKSKKSRADEE